MHVQSFSRFNVISEDGVSFLEIRDFDIRHTGEVLCEASNNAGTAISATVVNIKPRSEGVHD